MSWQTPKTDWHPSNEEGLAGADMNRIEGNTEYLYELTELIATVPAETSIANNTLHLVWRAPFLIPAGYKLVLRRLMWNVNSPFVAIVQGNLVVGFNDYVTTSNKGDLQLNHELYANATADDLLFEFFTLGFFQTSGSGQLIARGSSVYARVQLTKI